MTYPDDASQQQAMLIDEQEWLEELARDEAARREFHDRLASTYQKDERNEPQQSN
jgi:hypothetical protein